MASSNSPQSQAVSSSIITQKWFWKKRLLSIPNVLNELDLLEGDDYNQAWKKTVSSPSEVHVELLKSGSIPDPYIGFNEHQVQWIGEVEWLYKCNFELDKSTSHKYAKLIFEGLDTICDVYLNETKILATNNMFRTYEYPILLTDQDGFKAENILLLHFKPAKALAKSEEAKYGKVRAGSTNLGDPSRVYVRKAQYDWRWDWGPELMTCGPYRPITLLTYTSRIADMYAHIHVDKPSTDQFSVSLELDVTLEGSFISNSDTLFVKLLDEKKNILKSEIVEIGKELTAGSPHSSIPLKKLVSWNDLQKAGVKLWWPVGYGEQKLYTLEMELVTVHGDIIDKHSKRIGFRKAQLIQEAITKPDQYGAGVTFLFEINDVRMFMGGSNWVPADNFLTQITEYRYRAWLTLLRDGNQNMVRLWGGGIYEPDVFYDICDELGLLVWQDFQFACGVYPAHEEFVASVKQEAIDNVTRLRHHPSIVCFCGNNEDYQMVLQWGDVAELPARLLYEHVFPEVIDSLTEPPIPYHRGSPYGGKGWDTSDPTVGDVHQWNIWGGKELQYQEYDKMGGRFVSEFGIPSMPSMQTIEYWMQGADKSQWYAQSQLMAQHTKAGSFERRFAIVMNENFRLTTDLETHVFNTQMMQSEGVGFAYRSWRRQWKGKGREYTAGVLVWQANDCWPVVSWAITDYFLRPKPIYYTISRQLAPITVGIFRNVVKNRDNDRPRQFYEFGAIQTLYATLEIWGTNSTLQERSATLELRFFDLRSPEWTYTETHSVILLTNQTSELIKIKCPGPSRDVYSQGDPLSVESATVVASARLLEDQTGQVLARYSDWPEPYRFLQPPDPKLAVEIDRSSSTDETRLTLNVERPAKCVVLSVEGATSAEVQWSDNAVDIVPGDKQVITAKGLGNGKLKVAYFGNEKAHEVRGKESSNLF